MEALTDRLEAEAEHYIRIIDELGGMVAAIEQGYVQREIEQAAYVDGQSVESGSRIIVGVNKFREEHEPEPEVFVVPEETERKQIEELVKAKRSRDKERVQRTLDAVERVAQGEENLMPVIMDAVRAYATVGEICQRLQNVFGEYEPMAG
jgi:methylmalonyl-CoA mutase, N-terminal domain